MHQNRITKAVRFAADRDYRFNVMAGLGRYNAMDDREYLERYFRARMKKPLDLEHPQTFNEKLQWLKLYNRRPEYTVMVDKYAVRAYIREKLGEEYLIPLLGVWEDPESIDFGALPRQFVLKCNHNSGLGMCICRDKEKLDIKNAKAMLRRGLRQDYYLTGREWLYKNVPRRIIAEQYMTDDEADRNGGLVDYKFFCFDGYVDCVMVCTERGTGAPQFYFFDRAWSLLRINVRGREAPDGFTLPGPPCIDGMFRIAERLSEGLPFVRVDLYSCAGRVYFGELTFFPESGFDPNLLPETDRRFGELIDLTKVPRCGAQAAAR